jgi:hypothetical protein
MVGPRKEKNMKLETNTTIDLRDIVFHDQEDDRLWKISIEGVDYWINDTGGIIDLYREQKLDYPSHEDGFVSTNVLIERFDNGYELAKYIVEEII